MQPWMLGRPRIKCPGLTQQVLPDELLPDQCNALRNASASRVDRHVIPIPGMIIAPHDGVPIGQSQPGIFHWARLDATTMFFDIRADRFDFHDVRACSEADIAPCISRQHPIIYAVANNSPP